MTVDGNDIPIGEIFSILTGFPRDLGTIHSYPFAVDMKPFS